MESLVWAFYGSKMQQCQDTSGHIRIHPAGDCLPAVGSTRGSRGKWWEVEGDEAACHVLEDGLECEEDWLILP